MKKFKIKIKDESEFITAENEQEANEIFWRDNMYPNTDMENYLDSITEIEEFDDRKCHLCGEPTKDKYCQNDDCAEFVKDEMDDFTRVFFAVTHEENNTEIFEFMEEANKFAEETDGQVCVAEVRNAYREKDNSWNYEDLNNTFNFIQ